MAASSRQYDLLVWGATGYTGKYTAEHIAGNFPTDIRWAIAGRSASKLQGVAAECKLLNPDRIQPVIEVCNLDDGELDSLVKKTVVLLATVGPYSLYGEKAFKACAQNGTHYVDVTGEVPYVAKMIQKYEDVAKTSGAIMIPQIGIESAPADLVTWSLVDMIRERFSAPTAEVVVSLQMSGMPSGGTMNTVFSFFDAFSLKEIREAHSPYALSPVPAPKIQPRVSWTTKLFGVRSVRDLGILTSSPSSVADTPIVQRSWGLLDYGPNFHFSLYMKARNHLNAILIHFSIVIGSLLLTIPVIRSLLKTRVYQPGQGESRDQAKKNSIAYKGIGKPDLQDFQALRACCTARYNGSLYQLTGILIAQAALSIARDGHELSGGIYTPACLGQKYIDRLDGWGLRFEKTFL